MSECNDIMQCHNYALTTEGTTLQSTVSTKIIIGTPQAMANGLQSNNIYKTKSGISPISNAKQIAYRLVSKSQSTTTNHTTVNNISKLRTNTKWELSPTRKARNIADRLIYEHYILT